MSEKPVTVAVLADTHVNSLEELPPELLETLTRADMIIHLGDYEAPELLYELRKLGKFCGVMGNHDTLIDGRELRRMEVLEVGGKRLGLIHGLFIPVGCQKRMKALFDEHKIDILLYGHTHLGTWKEIEGVLLFNPGTVTGQFPATCASFGLLTLDGTIKSEIITLDYQAPGRRTFLSFLPAIIIRNGIRWLEAWPNIDITPLFRKMRSFFVSRSAGAERGDK